ncbi:hypothetical protein S40288_00970 [Stachybotrys chartarum IBT 40288]|nr:hypothetical protein S40288_00970 [Stachybotrys chartarum IBT 40288]
MATAAAEHIFQTAINAFEVVLSERQREQFSLTTTRRVKAQVLMIQNDQEKSKAMMNLNRLHCFIEAFEHFDESCKALCINIAKLPGYIWGPLRYILQIAKEDPKTLDHVLESYFDLGQRLPYIYRRDYQAEEASVVARCLAHIYEDLLNFHTDLLKLFSARTWKRTFDVNWKDYTHNRPFKVVLQSFESHRNLLQGVHNSQQHRALQDTQQRVVDVQRRTNDHIMRYQRDWQDVQDHINQYEDDRAILLAEAKASEIQRKDVQYTEVLRWLCSPEFKNSEIIRHRKLQKDHEVCPATGKWILSEDKVAEWMAPDPPSHSVLWIHGTTGTGKSTLASLIIQHLQEERRDATTSYFYCNEADQNLGESVLLAILKSVLRQALHRNREILPIMHERRMNGKRGVEVLDDDAAARTLLELQCDVPAKHFIVIDGVDEIKETERKSLVATLCSIVNRSDDYTPGRIRVLLVSNDSHDLNKTVQNAGDRIGTYELNRGKLQKDIELYVKKQVEVLQSKFDLNESDAQCAWHLVCIHSQGMFLYARLVMDDLLRRTTAKSVTDQLDSRRFPETLEKAYATIINRLRENDYAWTTAKKIFSWLVCAKRPLKWHELQAIMSMDVDMHGDVKLHPNERSSSDVREVCGSVIHVMDGTNIELVHHTAKAHLLKNESWNLYARECDMAILCLSYLSSSCFRYSAQYMARRLFLNAGYYAFQDYATAKWEAHLMTAIEKVDSLDQTDRQRLTMTLSRFVEVFETDLNSEIISAEVENLAVQDCRATENCEFHHYLLVIRRHRLNHERREIKVRNLVSFKTLREGMEKSRSAIRAMAEDGTPSAKIKGLYGEGLWKCERVTCPYFHEGYDTETSLEQHKNRHIRPFICPQNCSFTPFGFSTSRDMERHKQMYHPDLLEQTDSFTQLGRVEAKDDDV